MLNIRIRKKNDTFKKHKFKIQKHVNRWDEGLPLGNGKIGTLIWGECNKLNITLDRADIWENKLHPNVYSKDFNFEYLKKISRTRKIKKK